MSSGGQDKEETRANEEMISKKEKIRNMEPEVDSIKLIGIGRAKAEQKTNEKPWNENVGGDKMSSRYQEKEETATNEETINKRWRGELSITKHGTYIEIEWKKIVQDHRCVRAMEFFVDGEKEKDIWGAHKETVRINRSKKLSLKVEVFFTISGTQGRCYGSRSRCKCFEATTDVNFAKIEEKEFFESR